MRVAIVITALVLGVILAVDACAQCLPVDESVVTLTGQVILRTYPGPPNYEDIKRGDRAESHLFSFYRRPSAHMDVPSLECRCTGQCLGDHLGPK